ncbi:lipopolysaccharide heptosyltransferase I [Burkholderiaceae bacterium DAT-1]|nr:lipopolysaccharide heptosyltransferase I [Burkholderiaceae bacterium DAT-1]
MPKILIVRLSSMGDVIHNFPAITDLANAYPNADIHWAVEEGFADLPRLHPAVTKVIPFALRRWRKNMLSRKTWSEISAFRHTLASEQYDLIIDSQGLVKSAIVSSFGHAPTAGYDRRSIREPLASLLYDRRFAVSRDLHAVIRNRLITAAPLGYTPDERVNYGITAPDLPQMWRGAQPYVVCLTATSRDDKLWANENWIELGTQLAAQGLRIILPWGSPREAQRAQEIAAQITDAVVAPKLTLPEGARLLQDARAVVGVDTGLVHLAAAVGTPVVALYCASNPGLTGVLAGGFYENLGEYGAPPRCVDVMAATQRALEARTC